MTRPNILVYRNEKSLLGVIDDYESLSLEHNFYSAGAFCITINYNIPNAFIFEVGYFISCLDFVGVITKIEDEINESGKGGQKRTITGYDVRNLYKQRIIKNLNAENKYENSGKGEKVITDLINSECQDVRSLPITIQNNEDFIGDEYTVSEAYSNLYSVLETISKKTNTGWKVAKSETGFILSFYSGEDKSNTVIFSKEFETLKNGKLTESNESYINSVLIGGQGDGEERDLYLGEKSVDGGLLLLDDFINLDVGNGDLLSLGNISPMGADLFEGFVNASTCTNEDDYIAEAESYLNQYADKLTVDGNGLIKSAFQFRRDYNIGDIIKVRINNRENKVKVNSITEHWQGLEYGLNYQLGKIPNTLNDNLRTIINQLQYGQITTDTKDSIKWFDLAEGELRLNTYLTQMKEKEVIYNKVGLKLSALEQDKRYSFSFVYNEITKLGAKTYHVYLDLPAEVTEEGHQVGIWATLPEESGLPLTQTYIKGGLYVMIISVTDDGKILINQ